MRTLRLIKSIGRSPSRLALLLIPLVFACLALSPGAQAVSPPPDGDSTWCFNNITFSKQGEHVFRRAIVTIQFTGTFTGTFVGRSSDNVAFGHITEKTTYNGEFTGTVTRSGITKSYKARWDGQSRWGKEPETVEFRSGVGNILTATRTSGCGEECEDVSGCKHSGNFTYEVAFRFK